MVDVLQRLKYFSSTLTKRNAVGEITDLVIRHEIQSNKHKSMTNIHTEAKHEMMRIERGSDRMSSERQKNKGADRKNAKDWRL